MKKILEKLARMPKFISGYKKIVHFMAIIVFIVLVLPFAFLGLALAAFWRFLTTGIKDDSYEKADKERGALTDKQIEEDVIRWANAHSEKFNYIDIQQITTHNDSYLEISLYPNNSKSLPIFFQIGGQVLLYIKFGQFGQMYGLEFDTENGRGYESINAPELEKLLESYLGGNYYAIHWMIDERIIRTDFYVKNLQSTYGDYSGELCIFERKVAIQKRLNFAPL